VLASFLGASAQAAFQSNAVELWNAGKRCVGGEVSASGACPASTVRIPRAGSLQKKCPVQTERDMLRFS